MSRSTTTASLATTLLAVASLAGCAATKSPAAATGSAMPSAHSSPGQTTPLTPSGSAVNAQGAPSGGAGGVPAAAWIAPDAIPLNSSYHWASATQAAKADAPGTFTFENFCHSTRPTDFGPLAQHAVVASAQLDTSSGNDDWLAQETILEPPGSSSGAKQTAFALFRDLVNELKSCGSGTPHATVKATASGGDTFAVTVAIPTSTGATITLHDYLAVPDGAVAELSVWAAPYPGNQPKVSWPGTNDGTVLDSLKTALCDAYQDC